MPIRIATVDDADQMAPVLRPADATEVLRMGEGSVASVLRRSIARSVEAYVFEDGDHPLAVYGIVQPSAWTRCMACPGWLARGILRHIPSGSCARPGHRWLNGAHDIRSCQTWSMPGMRQPSAGCAGLAFPSVRPSPAGCMAHRSVTLK